MAPQTPYKVASGSESCCAPGAWSYAQIAGPPLRHRLQVAYRNAANPVTENMTQIAHLKIVHKIRSSKNMELYYIGCEWMHFEVVSWQLTIWCTAGVCRELCDQLIAGSTVQPPWFKKACIHTVHKIEHHDVVSSGSVSNESSSKHFCEWTK
jgi:hypothetical protein